MEHSFSLEGKVIIITGGTGGLGSSFLDGIVEAGGTVGILGRNRRVAEEMASKINRDGGKAVAICADVTKKTDLINAKKLVLDTYGKIDGLINAAESNMTTEVENNLDIFNMDLNGLKQIMEVNLWGTVLATQVFGDAIARHGEGSIVNISSVAAQRVIRKIPGYSMAKASVECFTKWFAVELGKRHGDAIRINAIAPGFFSRSNGAMSMKKKKRESDKKQSVIVDKIPFQRLGEPEELKGIAVWLMSDASKFVTGTTISIDGGFHVDSGLFD